MEGFKEWFWTSFSTWDWLWGLVVAYAVGLLLTLTTVWQLAIIGGFIGGMAIRKKAGIAWWVGFAGVALAWLTIVLVYVAIGPAWKVMDLVVDIIVGVTGLAGIGLALTLVIGGLAGGVGGFLGFSIDVLIRSAWARRKGHAEI
jgi:hypothetical protein